MIPDIKAIVNPYLNGHPDLAAIEVRVATKTPKTITRPWVRVTQLDATAAAASRTEHLVAYLVQFDCYAGQDGGATEANLVARIVRAALHVMPDQVFADAVVTAVRFTGMLDLPDTDMEGARDRVIVTAQIWAHPTSGS